MTSPITLGLDTFSYHRYFGEFTPWEARIETRWTTDDFLTRAAQLGVDAVSLQTIYMTEFASVVTSSPAITEAGEKDPVTTLRDRLDAHGWGRVICWGHPAGLEGGTRPDKVEEMRRWMDISRALGCDIMRFVGGYHYLWKIPAAERRARLTPIIAALAEDAARLNLTLAMENHADFAMRDIVGIVRDVGAPNLGICLDTGNAVRVGDDLLEAVELAAPYTKMVHLKDMVVQDESRGDPSKWWPSAPLGRGDYDLPAVLSILRGVGYTGCLFIEMSPMFSAWSDEDAAIAESVTYLRALLAE